MAKASWPVEFKLDSYLEGYQRYGAIHRLNFLLHQLQPPASEVEATRERLFHLVKSIYGTQYLQHHYSQYPEEAVVHLPWASEIQEVRSKLYTTLDESLQRAREHRDKGQIFVMQDQIGNFLLEKGAFEMALSVFQKNTNEWSTLEERLLVFIQCIRCHFANEAYDQAGELAVRALELIPSSSSSSSSSSSTSSASIVSSSSSSSTGPSSSSSIYEDQMNCFLAAAGIAAFRTRQYSTAVSYFLRISPSIGHVYGDFIVDRDVLVYGCLCALATFSRDELASRLLQNQTFSGLFSLSPAILAIVLDFYDGKFSEGLTKLAAFFQQAGADYHLMGVAGNLNKTIRETALIRYIQPFSHVNLTKMAAVFHSPLDTLHHELNTLILSRRLSGMIDSHQNIYVAKTVDTRTAMFNTALSTVDTFLSEAEATFYRMNLQLAFSPHHL